MLTFRAIYGWYNFFGYLSTALGALTSGYMISKLTVDYHMPAVNAYRSILVAYATFGALKTIIYLCLSRRVEPASPSNAEERLNETVSFSKSSMPTLTGHICNWLNKKFILRQSSSRHMVTKLCALFILDAIGGGFVLQSMIIYWFHERFQMNIDMLGLMMMAANLISGFSAILVTPLVGRIGAINTMVFTHVIIGIVRKIEKLF